MIMPKPRQLTVLHRFQVRAPSRRRYPYSPEESAYRVQVSELVDHGATSGVQKEIVALIAVACTFKNFRCDKAARGGGSGRDVAADLFKNTSHGRYGFRIEFTHCHSLTNPLSLAARADAFGPVEDRKIQYCISSKSAFALARRAFAQANKQARPSALAVQQFINTTSQPGFVAGSTLGLD